MAEIIKKDKIESTQAPPVEEAPKIEVDPAVLKGILEKLEGLEKSSKEKDDQIEILRQSVSRYRLEEAESKTKPVGLPIAKLMVYNDKVVTAFQLVRNKYIYNPAAPNTVAGEDLAMKLTYLDGSVSPEIPYGDFFRTKQRVEVVKVGDAGIEERIDRNGVVEKFPVWVVEFVDKNISDKQHNISIEFINP